MKRARSFTFNTLEAAAKRQKFLFEIPSALNAINSSQTIFEGTLGNEKRLIIKTKRGLEKYESIQKAGWELQVSFTYSIDAEYYYNVISTSTVSLDLFLSSCVSVDNLKQLLRRLAECFVAIETKATGFRWDVGNIFVTSLCQIQVLTDDKSSPNIPHDGRKEFSALIDYIAKNVICKDAEKVCSVSSGRVQYTNYMFAKWMQHIRDTTVPMKQILQEYQFVYNPLNTANFIEDLGELVHETKTKRKKPATKVVKTSMQQLRRNITSVYAFGSPKQALQTRLTKLFTAIATKPASVKPPKRDGLVLLVKLRNILGHLGKTNATALNVEIGAVGCSIDDAKVKLVEYIEERLEKFFYEIHYVVRSSTYSKNELKEYFE